MKWATSKEYVTTVGEEVGWVSAPPGTRKSTYDNPEVPEGGAVREVVYQSIANADITKPTKDPVPYIGIQYVAIPEFQGIGTQVGQQIAAALAGQVTVDQALETAQRSAERTMKQAGYPKKLSRPSVGGPQCPPARHSRREHAMASTTTAAATSGRCRRAEPAQRQYPAAGRPFGDRPVLVDDRAAGDDAVVLVPIL